MEVRAYDTTAEFRAVAQPLLDADPIKNTVLNTAVGKDWPDALLLTLHDNGILVGAVVQTPPYPLLVTAVPVEAAEFAAKAVHDRQPVLSGATGPVDQVEAFVAAWTKITGKEAILSGSRRQFQLDKLQPPTTKGEARQATQDDLPLLIDWNARFMAETLPAEVKKPPAKDLAVDRLSPSGATVLWVVDGTPVAMAGATGPIKGTARVSPVYTASEHRGNGYGSAATAAISQWALDQGAKNVLLFTDLSNPTTNRIYPAIGYRPLEDSAEYRF
ncbi:GNAT family N-acetyltransferase [Kibdelosporangium philippinense]|uniref:GNAT family N-acetyltransferase n=1 Tax=Kibdelosporangium philippinense TaxID=211113 RepID=A0ABS8ZNS6_9PSEU|nr:GNAT family N-acetyltransferase [Kibdelosporangium philippinense]MCE7008291.1 GNAT family N-acetyltransferase [Kibdelosporangium philippinense]